MSIFRRHAREKPKRQPLTLDTPLIYLSPDGKNDPWTVRDAFEGIAVFGKIGSGKTSGSGQTVAKAFLAAGFGGLVLCAKPEERETWEGYACAAGREHDLIVISPEADPRHHTHWRFNFLNYEMARPDGGGMTENLVHLFTSISEIVEARPRVADGDQFWERAMTELVTNAVSLLRLSRGTLTLDDITRLVLEAPRHEDQPYDERWQENSFCARLLREADEKLAAADNARDAHDFEITFDYWTKNFAGLGDRTRGSIVATFSGIANMLSHGYIWELFSTTTSIVPEVSYRDGAIIVVDLPIQRYHKVGRIAQTIWKHMWQRAVLARDVNAHPRPVFLWADEAQHFMTSHDFEYQATCRSARASTVFLTQNISMYYATLGAGGRDAANALLGNFGSLIFHQQNDVPTNMWASDTIGKVWVQQFGGSTSTNPQGTTTGANWGWQQLYKVDPVEFTTLRRGGPANGLEVDAYWFQGGRIFEETGDTYVKVIFRQG